MKEVHCRELFDDHLNGQALVWPSIGESECALADQAIAYGRTCQAISFVSLRHPLWGMACTPSTLDTLQWLIFQAWLEHPSCLKNQ